MYIFDKFLSVDRGNKQTLPSHMRRNIHVCVYMYSTLSRSHIIIEFEGLTSDILIRVSVWVTYSSMYCVCTSLLASQAPLTVIFVLR